MKSKKQRPGIFIIVEGGEGCGKSTIAKKLNTEILHGGFDCSVYRTKEPGGTFEGMEIRKKLLDPNNNLTPLKELELFEQDRRAHIPHILRRSERDWVIICDRYNGSTFAYQVKARQVITPEEFDQRDREIVGDLLPDLSILLDIDPKIGFQRLINRQERKDRIEQEAIEFHRQVRQGFLDFVVRRPEYNWVVIDANQSPEQILMEVKKAVFPLIARFHRWESVKNWDIK